VARAQSEVEMPQHHFVAVGFLPIPAAEGRQAELILTFRDITPKKTAETKLAAVVEATPEPFIIVEANGRIQRVNRQAEILFGYSREELIGQSFKMLVPERFRAQHDAYAHDYQHLPVPRRMSNGKELWCLTRAGEEIPMDIGLSPVVTPDGTTIMVHFHDIRAQKREQALLHEALQKADAANRSKSRFLAAASHDLRQPMQSISMNLGVLAGTINAAEKKRIITQTRMALDSTNKLLNSLLNITKLESGKVQPEIESFFIRNTLQRVYNTESQQVQKKAQNFSVCPSSLAVCSDPALLEQLLTNLVANAVRYTPPGGHILLGCRRRPSTLRIEVLDNGPGIPHSALGLIFEEYRQLEGTRHQGQGLGLGLSIAKLLAELLHLKLEVRSTPGKGSCFSVEVPLASELPKVQLRPRATKSRAQNQAFTVLLIDDDEAVLDATGLFLDVSGFRVLTARSSAHAVALLAQETPDLVITDYGLAQHETGLDLLQSIRNTLGTQVPAIVLTGDISLQRNHPGVDEDVEIVAKPVDPQVLLQLVQQRT
jgi:PAS domain S-box-containing protein